MSWMSAFFPSATGLVPPPIHSLAHPILCTKIDLSSAARHKESAASQELYTLLHTLKNNEIVILSMFLGMIVQISEILTMHDVEAE